MKKTVFSLLALMLLFVSCSNETSKNVVNPKITKVTVTTWNTKAATPAVNGQEIKAVMTLDASMQDAILACEIKFDSYLSKDETLSSDDVALTKDGTIGQFFIDFDGTDWTATTTDTLPVDTAAGDYYYIFSRKSDDASKTYAKASAKFSVAKYTSIGAFKVYNSWGDTWPNCGKGVTEGYYYLPFEQVIKQGMNVYYYQNSIAEAYPKMIGFVALHIRISF
jgi:hypothetical protein